MSDTSGDKPISLSKSGGTAKAAKPAVARPPLPQTMRLAFAALAALVILTVVSALALLGSSTTLQNYLITQNAKAKKPKKNYTFDSAVVLKDLHTLRVSSLVLAGVLTFILLGILFAFRNPRRASAARWLLLVALIITSAIFRVVPIKGYPAFAKDTGVASGVAAIVLLVSVFLPASAAYFKECREASLPPERRGQPAAERPRLFGPRPAPAGRPARPTARTAPVRQAAPAPNAGRGKAKVRSDSEAIARGADLARSRAKASKSRRTDV